MVDVPLYKLELAEWPIHQVTRACRAERESRESGKYLLAAGWAETAGAPPHVAARHRAAICCHQ